MSNESLHMHQISSSQPVPIAFVLQCNLEYTRLTPGSGICNNSQRLPFTLLHNLSYIVIIEARVGLCIGHTQLKTNYTLIAPK